MDDDIFFNLKRDSSLVSSNEHGSGKVSTPVSPATPNSSTEVVIHPNNVIEYKIHSITSFRVYPNGQFTPPKTISWFQDKQVLIKRKAKKKKEVSKATLMKEEVY